VGKVDTETEISRNASKAIETAAAAPLSSKEFTRRASIDSQWIGGDRVGSGF